MVGKNLTAIYVPEKLMDTVEETRKKLGMNRSRFITYCITRTLQELSVLTEKVHSN